MTECLFSVIPIIRHILQQRLSPPLLFLLKPQPHVLRLPKSMTFFWYNDKLNLAPCLLNSIRHLLCLVQRRDLIATSVQKQQRGCDLVSLEQGAPLMADSVLFAL